MKKERNLTAAPSKNILKPAFDKARLRTLQDKKLSTLAEDQRLFDRDFETLLTDISLIMSCQPELQAQTDERIRSRLLGLKATSSLPNGTPARMKNTFALQAQNVANRKNPVAEIRVKTRRPRSLKPAPVVACKDAAVETPKTQWKKMTARRTRHAGQRARAGVDFSSLHPSGRRPPHLRPGMTAAEISAYMSAYEAAKASQGLPRLQNFADGSWLSPRPL